MRMGDDGLMDRTKAKSIINIDCQFGLEAGLQLKKQYPDARMIVCSMGPGSFENALKTAISMGYDEAYLLSDRKLGGSDTYATGLALATMLKHFGQHPKYLGWALTEDDHLAYVFEGADGKTLVAAWTSKKGEIEKSNLGQEIEFVKPQTGEIEKSANVTLSNSPVFLLNPPARLIAAARANKSRPFPWDGDYTDAKEISVTYATDGKVISKGLHTTDGEAILKAVQLYGDGHAQVGFRDGTAPGGNSFVCDPNFLSYKTGPIEITIVAQRKDPAQAAVIDLEYEYDNPADPSGIHPFKKIAREIPEGDDWHTLTWRLDDAEFNAYWGFHFRFPAGPFNIRGVTVKKL